MWPGQQPPGGENPQHQNPYQQPGYPQQPNPYQQPGHQQPGHQQPGYQQPNPYQQPTVSQYAVPGPPQPPQPPQENKKKTALVAIVAVAAVVATAAVTGVVVLRDDDGDRDGSDKGAGAASSAPPASASPSEPAKEPSPTADDNPRGGATARPTIAGWKVVVNPKHGTMFDVPPEWELQGAGVSTGFSDEKKGDGSPVVAMSATAHLKNKWCEADSNGDGKNETWRLASSGTKGGKGAKDTATAASNEAVNWVWAAYAQTEPKGVVRATTAKSYTTKSGLVGSVATATAVGTKKPTKCDTDGKAIAFSFKDAAGEIKSWVLYANTGVKEELPEATIQQVLSTVRLTNPSGS
ncbi:hypothetical protein ACH4E8_14635 [Streptomyces sp. NPDC017979]|uniref:hypothetical protein n=1 Tax=Streptomyces sp. NPDC017979 TaxID=3365024 RepID=UPI0037AFC361